MTDTNKNTTANSNISINNNIISNRYRMPPEWHPHYACCILYPHRSTTFPSVHKAQNEIRNLCRMIRDVGKEDVLLFCNDDSTNENETGDDDYSKIVEDLKLLFASEERKNYDDEGDDKEEEEEGNNNNNNKKKIFINVCPCDDSWCRDTGPTFVFLEEYNKNYVSDGDDVDNKWTTKGFIGLDWDFNAYGGLYGPCNLDRNVAGSIVRVLDDRYPLIKQKVQHKSIPIILEGGSFHTDGEGTVLTTEECLLNPNRNPNFTKKDIEQYLQTYLGASIIIWLPFGLAYDVDTNGHVDNMATFVKPGEIVMAWTDDYKKDEQNYIRVRDNLKVLDKVVDAKGRKIRIHKLHIPDPMFYTEDEVNSLSIDNKNNNSSNMNNNICNEKDDNCNEQERIMHQRLSASYINYYLANNAVIVPQFGDIKRDQDALDVLNEIFNNSSSLSTTTTSSISSTITSASNKKTLEVVGVYSKDILLGGGNLHCVTQQVPVVPLP